MLPPRGPAFESLCVQAQRDPGCRALVFEALLHGTLGLLVDSRLLPPSYRDGRLQWVRANQFTPMAMRHQRYGVHEFSWAVYSSVDYWFEIPGPMGAWATNFNFVSGETALEVLVQPREMTPLPMVVDPTWPHSVTLMPHELSAFWLAWQNAPIWIETRFDALGQSYPSDAMLARLRGFLPQLEISAACVWQGTTRAQPKRRLQTLAVRGADNETLLRICKALPLLNWGLPEGEAISEVWPASQRQVLAPQVFP
jgi:hypothetical protein